MLGLPRKVSVKGNSGTPELRKRAGLSRLGDCCSLVYLHQVAGAGGALDESRSETLIEGRAVT